MIELVHEVELFQLINEDGMLELEYLYFANPNEIMALNSDHQVLPAIQERKKTQQVSICLPTKNPALPIAQNCKNNIFLYLSLCLQLLPEGWHY